MSTIVCRCGKEVTVPETASVYDVAKAAGFYPVVLTDGSRVHLCPYCLEQVLTGLSYLRNVFGEQTKRLSLYGLLAEQDSRAARVWSRDDVMEMTSRGLTLKARVGLQVVGTLRYEDSQHVFDDVVLSHKGKEIAREPALRRSSSPRSPGSRHPRCRRCACGSSQVGRP